jgi:hypothetical protein
MSASLSTIDLILGLGHAGDEHRRTFRIVLRRWQSQRYVSLSLRENVASGLGDDAEAERARG